MTRAAEATDAEADAAPAAAPGPFRAWCYLVRLSARRQARAGQMVWIALGLLALTFAVVAVNALAGRWGMDQWRSPRGYGPSYRQWVLAVAAAPRVPPGSAVADAVTGAAGAILDQSGFLVFASWIVFSVFVSFLLPLWTLSFATEALGGEREDRTLVWLLARPIPRSGIYLAKFIGLLPYTVGLNLGGFGLLCLAAGAAGAPAWELFWPAVLLGTLGFSALFHLVAACTTRPAVVGIVYAFFLETLLGNMPGYMKRVSLGFYTRCMMFEEAHAYGLQPEKPSVYLPVSGATAAAVLLAVTAACLAAGTIVFARSEYRDASER